MADQWYYAVDGVRTGPCTTQELRQRAAAGRILPTDMIWKEGVVEGALAKNVKNLLPASVAKAATVPADATPPGPIAPEPVSDQPSSEMQPPQAEDAQLQPENRPGRRPQPEQQKKGTATAGKGAVIFSQDGIRVNYKKKCTVCGHEDPGRHSMLIRQGWVRTNYYCPKCRKPRTVEILGAMR
jgi:GYF domain 2